MSDEETHITRNPISFEQRVLQQLENISSRITALERRADTSANVDDILREFQTLNVNVQAYLAKFDRKLDVINNELLQVKANQLNIEDRLRTLELENRPQVIPQERNF